MYLPDSGKSTTFAAAPGGGKAGRFGCRGECAVGAHWTGLAQPAIAFRRNFS
jgi:hypothetical protein